jgi:hypothetical protein
MIGAGERIIDDAECRSTPLRLSGDRPALMENFLDRDEMLSDLELTH